MLLMDGQKIQKLGIWFSMYRYTIIMDVFYYDHPEDQWVNGCELITDQHTSEAY